MSTSTDPNLSSSSRRFNVYLRYKIVMPCLDLETSMPRKYLKAPRSLISYSNFIYSFSLMVSLSSSPASSDNDSTKVNKDYNLHTFSLHKHCVLGVASSKTKLDNCSTEPITPCPRRLLEFI